MRLLGEFWSARSALGVLVTGLALSACGQVFAQAGPRDVTVEVGGSSVKLLIANGDCALERSNPTDKRAIELVESLIAGNNQLHLSETSCGNLMDWRAGKLATLREYRQVQSGLALQKQNFTGQEKAVIAANCNAIRKQGGALLDAAASSIKQRLEVAEKQALIQNLSLLGALDEDDYGCYVGLLIKGQTEQGAPKTQLCVFATTVLNGKMVFLYHYSDKLDEAEIDRLLNGRKATAKAHVEANGGHRK